MLLKRIIKWLIFPDKKSKPEMPYPLTSNEQRRLKNCKRYSLYTTQLYNIPFQLNDSHGFLHSLNEIFNDEVYYFKTDSATPFIIDCGANIGVSIAFFKALYPQASIVTFEPDREVFRILEKNIQNAAYSNITLHNAAVWTEDTYLNFFEEGSLAGSLITDYASKNRISTVKAMRLKSFLQQSVDFLKIDIEGAENFVLPDIEPELKNVKAMFLEYHSTSGEKQLLGDLLNCISRSGFRYSIENATFPRKRPFVNRKKKGFDVQLNISCFR